MNARLGLALAAVSSCAAPRRPMPVEAISTVGTLEELMHVQATYADPQFGKIDAAAISEADFAGMVDAAKHLEATSKKLPDFSKGPEFDALAARLGEQAVALRAAAEAKNDGAARQALSSMKQACKSCHVKFR
jgi:cytochrome c556